MPTAADLTVRINADTSNAEAGIKRTDSLVKGLAGSVGKAAAVGVGAVIGGTAIGLGLAAKSALGFEQQMANVNSIMQLSGSALDSYSNQVLQLAQNPGITQSPTELAAGLYNIASSGFSGADGLTVLNAAAISATAGMTTTDVAAQGITAALNAYGLQATDAGKISDIMFQTVNDGVITFDQLANNMGNVLPVANSLGIGMDQVGAAYAQMTLNGVNASAAETQISALMRSALNPTTQLTAAVQAHGYASAESLIQTEGLSGYLAVLNDAAGGSQSAMMDLTGSQEAMNAATILGKGGVKDYNEELDKMQHASDGAGATQTALAKQMESSSFKIAKAKQSVQILATTLGGILTPIIGKAADGLTGFITKGLLPFGKTLGDAFKGTEGWQKQIEKLPQPLQRAGHALGSLADSFGDVGRAFQERGLAGAIQTLTTGGELHQMGQAFKAIGEEAWKALQAGFDAIPWGTIGNAAFDLIKAGIGAIPWGDMWDGMKDISKGLYDKISDAIKTTDWHGLASVISNSIKDKIGLPEGISWRDFAKALLKNFKDDFVSEVSDIMGSIDWSGIASGIGDFASGAWDAIKTGLSLAWDQITDLNWDNYIDKIGDFAGLVAGKIKDLPWGDYISAVGDFAGLVAGKIKDLPWGDYISAIGDFAGLVAGKIKDLPWGDYISAIGDFGALIGGKIKDLPWGDYLTAVADFGALIAGKIKDLPWGDYLTAVGDLGTVIGTKIKDLPWGDYITAVGDFAGVIAGKIKDLPWGDFITGDLDLGVTILTKIKDLPWGDFITGLVDLDVAIAGKIKELPWGDYITAIADFGALIAGKIVELPWGDYITAIADLNNLIVDKIVELPWGDYITGGVDLAAKIGEKIINLPWGDFITVVDLPGIFAAKVMKFVWPSISKEDILNALLPGNPAGGSQDIGGNSGLTTNTPQTPPPEGVPLGPDGQPQKPNGYGIRAPQGVTIKYTADTTDLENNSMLKGLFGGGTGAPPIQPIKIPAPDISMVSSVMIAVPQIVGQNMSAALSAASTYASAIGSVVGAAIGTMVGNVGALMGAFTVAVGTGMSAALSAASVYASAIYVSVSTNIGLMVGNTAALMGAFTVAVGEGMSAALGAAVVYSGAIVSAVAGAFGQIPGIAASAFYAVPDIIAGALSGAAGTAYAMGANIGASLAAGISSQVGAVAAAAAALAAAADAAVAARAKIASPSKVFMALGEHVGEGFALGIESKYGRAAGAGSGLAGASMPSGSIAGRSHGGTHYHVYITPDSEQFTAIARDARTGGSFAKTLPRLLSQQGRS